MNLIEAEQYQQEVARAKAEGREPDFSDYSMLPTPGTFEAVPENETNTPVEVETKTPKKAASTKDNEGN